MSGKNDGIGGLILLGAAVLVGAALLGGGGRKKEEEVSVVEDTPKTKSRCFVPGCKWDDVSTCPFCGNLVCDVHDVSCHCGREWGCCDCRNLVPEYCGSCI